MTIKRIQWYNIIIKDQSFKLFGTEFNLKIDIKKFYDRNLMHQRSQVQKSGLEKKLFELISYTAVKLLHCSDHGQGTTKVVPRAD